MGRPQEPILWRSDCWVTCGILLRPICRVFTRRLQRFRLFRLQQAPWDHWLLVRRTIAKPNEMAYYVVFGPAAASLEALTRIAGRRWPVEECFETAKQEVGLDGYEVRSWHAW